MYMKKISFLLFLSLLSIMVYGQTRQEDVEFILSDLILENYGEYTVKNEGVWGLQDGNVKRSVKLNK